MGLCSLPLSSSLPPAGSLGFIAAASDPVAAPAVPVAVPAAPASLFRPFDVASATPGVAPLLSGSSFAPACYASLPLGSAALSFGSAWLRSFAWLRILSACSASFRGSA